MNLTHTDNLVNLSFLFFVLFCFACVCFFYLFCFSWWKSHCWTWGRRIIDFLVIIRYLYSALMNWGLYGLVDWSLMQKLLFSPEFYDFLFILFKREIPPPSLWDIWLLKDCNSIPKWYIYIYIFSAEVYLMPHISYFAVCTQYLNCFQWFAGLSLKSQELTAIFLAVRLYCSFVMEYDIHTLLDLATFLTTLWVIYMIRFNLKSSYMEDKDNFAIYYVVSFR